MCRFWSSLFSLLETRISQSPASYPETVGPTEIVNRIPEEMIGAYVVFDKSNWDRT